MWWKNDWIDWMNQIDKIDIIDQFDQICKCDLLNQLNKLNELTNSNANRHCRQNGRSIRNRSRSNWANEVKNRNHLSHFSSHSHSFWVFRSDWETYNLIYFYLGNWHPMMHGGGTQSIPRAHKFSPQNKTTFKNELSQDFQHLIRFVSGIEMRKRTRTFLSYP